jgi:hypoxanthine phosphoribosyltransferase
MNGSLFFLVDLLRALPRDFRVECWRVHSYRGTTSSGRLNGLEQCWTDFSGHDVLIVDDILDTGVTLEAVQKHVIQCGARRVDACVLLKKTKTRQPKVKARWFGFAVDDDFVIGYGLDLDGRFRSLNDIRVLAAD